MVKKGMVLVVCALLLSNSMAWETLEVQAAIRDEMVNVNQLKENPFEDEQAKPISSMTMKEKVAQLKEQEAITNNVIEITGVLPGHVYIPKGTKFKVELVDAANSKSNKTGQVLDIRMVDNLIVNNVVVIPKGTVGTAYVYEGQKAGGFGRKGVLKIAGKEISTINGVSVPLRKGIVGMGDSDGGAVAVAAVVSLVGGLFMKGSNIDYPAGTDFEVEVKNNVDLNAAPNDLAKAMDTSIARGTSITVAVQ
jgi:hypothetical protein